MTNSELKAIRIDNLKRFFENKTLPVKDKSLLSQLMSGKASFGEKVSRRLEEEYGMGSLYLDSVPSEPTPVLIDPNLPHEAKDIHRPMTWSSKDPLPDDDYVFVPYLKESCFKGGAGAYEIPDYNGYRLPFGKSTLKRKGINPDNVFCCTLTGDSMEEKIAEDAAIAVDTGETAIRDGKIYAFAQDGMFRVKYLIRQPGNSVLIRSHNSGFYPDETAPLDSLTVIGRVFWWSVLD